jgi:hypothetical protein
MLDDTSEKLLLTFFQTSDKNISHLHLGTSYVRKEMFYVIYLFTHV